MTMIGGVLLFSLFLKITYFPSFRLCLHQKTSTLETLLDIPNIFKTFHRAVFSENMEKEKNSSFLLAVSPSPPWRETTSCAMLQADWGNTI